MTTSSSGSSSSQVSSARLLKKFVGKNIGQPCIPGKATPIYSCKAFGSGRWITSDDERIFLDTAVLSSMAKGRQEDRHVLFFNPEITGAMVDSSTTEFKRAQYSFFRSVRDLFHEYSHDTLGWAPDQWGGPATALLTMAKRPAPLGSPDLSNSFQTQIAWTSRHQLALDALIKRYKSLNVKFDPDAVSLVRASSSGAFDFRYGDDKYPYFQEDVPLTPDGTKVVDELACVAYIAGFMSRAFDNKDKTAFRQWSSLMSDLAPDALPTTVAYYRESPFTKGNQTIVTNIVGDVVDYLQHPAKQLMSELVAMGDGRRELMFMSDPRKVYGTSARWNALVLGTFKPLKELLLQSLKYGFRSPLEVRDGEARDRFDAAKNDRSHGPVVYDRIVRAYVDHLGCPSEYYGLSMLGLLGPKIVFNDTFKGGGFAVYGSITNLEHQNACVNTTSGLGNSSSINEDLNVMEGGIRYHLVNPSRFPTVEHGVNFKLDALSRGPNEGTKRLVEEVVGDGTNAVGPASEVSMFSASMKLKRVDHGLFLEQRPERGKAWKGKFQIARAGVKVAEADVLSSWTKVVSAERSKFLAPSQIAKLATFMGLDEEKARKASLLDLAANPKLKVELMKRLAKVSLAPGHGMSRRLAVFQASEKGEKSLLAFNDAFKPLLGMTLQTYITKQIQWEQKLCSLLGVNLVTEGDFLAADDSPSLAWLLEQGLSLSPENAERLIFRLPKGRMVRIVSALKGEKPALFDEWVELRKRTPLFVRAKENKGAQGKTKRTGHTGSGKEGNGQT